MQKLINQTLVNYSVYGGTKDATILFLHGWGRNSHDWDNLSRLLAKKYHCVALDLPGFGATIANFSQAWSVDDYAELVEEFLFKIKVRPDIIIAHSFGGKIAVKLASKYKLTKLVLISPSIAFNSNFSVTIKKMLFKILKFPAMLLGSNTKNKLALLMGSSDYKNAGELLPTFKNTVSEKLVADTKTITRKTLIVWGDNDGQLPVANAKTIRDLIKDSKIRVVWGAGHDPHLTHTNKLLKIFAEEGI